MTTVDGAAARENPPGFGKYTLSCRLGQGGMAEVFKGNLTGPGGFDKVVVIKRILRAHMQDPEFVRMFFDEARLAANLSHPNIVHIFEIDEFQGVPYLAMEYVHGPTLNTLIHVARSRQRVELGAVAKIISKICDALHHAHLARDSRGQPLGIVHRDVSPQNILVSEEGVPKLVDFGVAKARGRLVTSEAGMIKGKVRYAAPEQIMGQEVDGRADVFAAGVCLYEASTGQMPFYGDSEAAVMQAILKGSYVRPARVLRDFPEKLEEIIQWALKTEVSRRCPSAKALQEALEEFVDDGRHATKTQDVAAWIQELFPNRGGPPENRFALPPQASVVPLHNATPPPPPPPDSSWGKPTASLHGVVNSTPPDVSSPRMEVDVVLESRDATPAASAMPMGAPPSSGHGWNGVLVGLALSAVAMVGGVLWLSPPAPARPDVEAPVAVPPPVVAVVVPEPVAPPPTPPVEEAPPPPPVEVAPVRPDPPPMEQAPTPPPVVAPEKTDKPEKNDKVDKRPVVAAPRQPVPAPEAPAPVEKGRRKPAAPEAPPPSAAPDEAPAPADEGKARHAGAAGESPQEMARTEVRMAEMLLKNGKLPKAQKTARRATMLDPEYAAAHALLGAILAAQGDCAAAVRSFDAALAVDKADARARAGIQDCKGR